MKRSLIILILLVVPIGYFLLPRVHVTTPLAWGTIVKVEREPLAVWTTYEGVLESRAPALLMSNLHTSTTVVDLAPEGAIVSQGTVLVRFDASTLEHDVIKMERDYAAAESELNSFKYAKAPLELRELKKKVMETVASLTAEQNYLQALVGLVAEDLVTDQEIEKQKAKVAELTTELETVDLRLKLTAEYLHPATLKGAQAKQDTTRQELRIAREQVENCVIRAPRDGVVVYKPVYLGTEFRSVRIGDTIYPNQPFMELTDMRDLVVHSQVPEAELGRVKEGKEVFIQPLAFPEVRLRATVESVSPMAQNRAGRPVWEKFFHMVIGLDKGDARLRPGMSVTAQVLSYYKPDALSIPRAAVWWENGKPYGKVVTGSSSEIRPLKLGMANERSFEVIEGLEPGTEVRTQ